MARRGKVISHSTKTSKRKSRGFGPLTKYLRPRITRSKKNPLAPGDEQLLTYLLGEKILSKKPKKVKNPQVKKGKWVPVHAVRFNKGGSVSIMY